jgi:hypothetical protein
LGPHPVEVSRYNSFLVSFNVWQLLYLFTLLSLILYVLSELPLRPFTGVHRTLKILEIFPLKRSLSTPEKSHFSKWSVCRFMGVRDEEALFSLIHLLHEDILLWCFSESLLFHNFIWKLSGIEVCGERGRVGHNDLNFSTTSDINVHACSEFSWLF